MLLLIAALLTASPADSNPARPMSQLLHTTWTPKMGGGPIGITSLAQTTDGYLWIGTFFGLWRFDGVRFLRYVPLGGDSIPGDDPIGAMRASRDGSLWVVAGRHRSVTRLRAGRAVTYGPKEGIAGVEQLTESSKGVLVSGGTNTLHRFTGEKWERMDAAWGYPGKHARAVMFDRDDVLWVLSEDRVVYLPAGADKFVDPGIRVGAAEPGSTFVQDKDGGMWLAVIGSSVRRISKQGDTIGKPTVVEIDALKAMIDRGGSMWVASSSRGLWRVANLSSVSGHRINPSSPEAVNFTMKDGLLSDIPTALLQDREGNIWVGSGSGLERFREGAFAPVIASGPGRPRFITSHRDSSVWTGAFNDEVVERFGPGVHQRYRTVSGMVTVAEDRAGRALIVGHDTMFVLDGQRFTPLPLRRGTARGMYSLATDPGGTVWVYSQELGLLRKEGDSLMVVASLPTESYRHGQVFSDSKGRIWVAQVNRVARYADGRLTKYEGKQGINGFVYGFFEDRDGNIWAPNGDGLSRFTGDRFVTLTGKQGIPGSTVYGAAQDDTGAWWLATTPGILRFPAGEIEHVLADSTYVPHYRTFDESDGMVGALVKGYWGPILVKSTDGKIWVATDSGLAFIDPRRISQALPPPVNLEVARINGHEIAATDGATIPPGATDLEIDFTSLTFGTPERVQFRYRLVGSDTVWREVGSRRRAYYTGLAPKTYQFQVTASYQDGVWNQAAAGWSFRILPAWYQTLWFKALLILAIGGIGGAAMAFIQRGRHRRAEQALKDKYEATLAERARIAQDLHDTLLQGFAGVTLQLKAAEVALPAHPEVAAETIARVQQLARASMREARERVWDMRESQSRTEDLASALESAGRDCARGSGIELSVTVSGGRRRLAPALEDAAFRIGREAIVNAVRHADARRIEVDLNFGDHTLAVEVRDDGRGFSPVDGEEARRNGHFGLSGMRDRAGEMGGHFAVKPGSPKGTVVVLQLPLTS